MLTIKHEAEPFPEEIIQEVTKFLDEMMIMQLEGESGDEEVSESNKHGTIDDNKNDVVENGDRADGANDEDLESDEDLECNDADIVTV